MKHRHAQLVKDRKLKLEQKFTGTGWDPPSTEA